MLWSNVVISLSRVVESMDKSIDSICWILFNRDWVLVNISSIPLSNSVVGFVQLRGEGWAVLCKQIFPWCRASFGVVEGQSVGWVGRIFGGEESMDIL